MCQSLRTRWIPLLLLGLAPTGAAQEVCFDAADSAPFWARGESYKACFDQGGTSFIPYLGADAPGHRPLGLRVESVSVGGSELAFERSVEPQREGVSVAFERHAFTELYHASANGLEQAFRFDAPLGPGALSIRIALDTELVAHEQGGGVRFECALGGVQYGRATAIDARGRRADAPVSLQAGAIVIRVPEGFLASAAWPVLVDPLISSFAIDDSPAHSRLVDVAYDSSLGIYAVCWQSRFSSFDHDIYGNLLDSNGATLSTFALNVSGGDYVQPKIAGIDRLDQFMIAYRGNPGGGSQVYTRTLRIVGGQLVIDAPVPQMYWAASIDLGGDAGTEPPYRYCLVSGENGLAGLNVVGFILKPDGQWDGTVNIGDTKWQGSEPCISKTARGPEGEVRAWGFQYRGGFEGSNPRSWAGVLRQDASVEVGLAGGTGLRSISVSSPLEGEGGEPPILSVWGPDVDVGPVVLFGRVMRGQDPETPLQILSTEPAGTPYGADVDSDGSSFVLVRSEDSIGGTGARAVAETYQFSGGTLQLVESARLSLPIGSTGGAPAITSTRSGGGEPQRFFAAWHEETGTDHDIHGAIYSTPGVGVSYCVGAPNSVGAGARLHATGSISIALNQMTLAVEGCPPNRPGIFFLGPNSIQLPFGEGFRCIGDPSRRVLPALTTDTSGAASRPLDFGEPYGALVLPGSPGVNYQFWYRDPAGGPAAFNLSDALHVEHTP